MTTCTSPLPSIHALSGNDDVAVLPDLPVGHTLSEALLVGGVEGITCIFDVRATSYLLPVTCDA